jgi:hypothetical protein
MHQRLIIGYQQARHRLTALFALLHGNNKQARAAFQPCIRGGWHYGDLIEAAGRKRPSNVRDHGRATRCNY